MKPDFIKAREIINKCLVDQTNDLDLSTCYIIDLEQLPELFKCTHINKLDLSYSKIEDISLLIRFKQLNHLRLSYNKIKDADFLRELKKLKHLDLSFNKIDNINFIDELKQLEYLDLSYNKIETISFRNELKQLGYLNLLSNKIENVNFLIKLKQLSSLSLSANKIENISHLKELKQLKSLHLSSNKIENISSLKELKQLNSLYLDSNVVSDYSPIKELENLKRLDLSNNKILDLNFIKELKQLESLELNTNSIEDISFLKELKQLRNLDLSNNNIENISSIKELKQLKVLDLNFNRITDINTLKELTQLRSLDINYNFIENINVLKGLTQLRSLDISSNKIENISILEELIELEGLRLRNNKIINIPEFIFRSPKLTQPIDLITDKNPISNPPIEIIEQGKIAVLEWFDAKNRDKLNEIKIILIGDPEAGKTSLLKRLNGNEFDSNEPQTDGINIVDIDFSKSNLFKNEKKLHGIKGRFWDFGGQEIMSATHRLFLSNRAVYILLLQARDDKASEKQVIDWIEQIKATGGDSPVIVVANKIDINPSFDFENTYQIKQKYSQIKDFIKISNKTIENIDQLTNKLSEIIPEAGFLNSEVDTRYIHLKELIKKETRIHNYLNEESFNRLCEHENVKILDESSRIHAIDFFNKIGITSYFNEIKTSQYHVLDPNWITTGLYRILTSEKVAQQKGLISFDDLGTILNKEEQKVKSYHPFSKKEFKYGLKDERNFIVEVLCKNKLAFKLKNDQFIIPALLAANPEDALLSQFDSSNTLDLFFEYKSLPKNIISELLVELHRSGYLTEYWRTGGLIEKDNTKATIVASSNRIYINIISDNIIAGKDLMAYIEGTVDIVNQDLSELPKKKLPLPNTAGGTVEYQQLVNMLKKGEETYIHNAYMDDTKDFNIKELLKGITSDYDIIVGKLDEIIRGNGKIGKNTEIIKSKLNTHLDYLIKLDTKSKILKSDIITAVEAISTDQKRAICEEILTFTSNAFDLHQDHIDEKLEPIYNDIKKSTDLSMKLKLSIPFINLIGINLETELDIKGWSQRMYEKHELSIFKLFGKI